MTGVTVQKPALPLLCRKKEMKKYWDSAVSYENYLRDNEEKINQLRKAESEEDKTLLGYYELGLTRMKRVDKTYHAPQDQLEKLEEKKFEGKILVIAEGWCGDASMIVPVIHKFFEDKAEVRISYRDQHNLIDSFLTNGGKAIPIVLAMNEKDDVIGRWGPRTKYGTELLMKYKADPEHYTADDFHNDLQIYYTKNKGRAIIDEFLEIL